MPITTGDGIGSLYRLARLRTDAVVEAVSLQVVIPSGGSITTFTGSVGLYFSDGTPNLGSSVQSLGGGDGTNSSNASDAFSVAFFAFQLALAGVTTLTDETFQNATGNSVTDGFCSSRNQLLQPLWAAVAKGDVLVPSGSATAPNTGMAQSGQPGFGMTVDPGGFFDVTLTLTSAANAAAGTNGGIPYLYSRVEYLGAA